MVVPYPAINRGGIAVSENGTFVSNPASDINFTGNVLVTASGPTANVDILAGGVPTAGAGYGAGSYTFTVPGNVYQLQVECWGGGGGGGGANSDAGVPTSDNRRGSGGGGGGYALGTYTVTPGQMISIVVGGGGGGGAYNGGDGSSGGTTSTSLGIGATGGGAGVASTDANGGTGGSGFGGNLLNLQGEDGSCTPCVYTPVYVESGQIGYGGSAPRGGAGYKNNIGGAGYTPGGGASGGQWDSSSGEFDNGGAGAAGGVLITW